MKNPFRLGFLTHVEGKGDPAKIYEETLQLFVAAEALGFDAVWIAQHHFHIHPGRLPSPFPFLAAAAQRTRRIRLGTSIVVLPLELPLRVAEDAAVVDTLSGGRLELGVGSGGEAGEFQAFGLDASQRRQLTSQGIEMLRRSLGGKPLNDGGQRLDPPAPTLVDRLWQSAASAGGAQYVAQSGAGLMLSKFAWTDGQPTDVVQLPVARAYQDAWQTQPGQPRVALSRGIYPAATREAALADLTEAVMSTAAKSIRQGHFPAGLPIEEYCRRLHIFYGHPADVAADLAADRVFPHVHDLILQFSPVIPPLPKAIAMLELIATEVAPALGWRPQLETVDQR